MPNLIYRPCLITAHLVYILKIRKSYAYFMIQ